MTLGSTQPLRDMSTMNLPGGKGRPARETDDLTAVCERIVYKIWEPRRLITLWAFVVCYRDRSTLSFMFGVPVCQGRSVEWFYWYPLFMNLVKRFACDEASVNCR
jgi:hypothetical protein